MVGKVERYAHIRGLQVTSGPEYLCLVCWELLDMDGVERWVRRAEEAWDEAHLAVEGDGFAGVVREELQREVYRRRRLKYGLQDMRRTPVEPKMILVAHDTRWSLYECRIFYKEQRPEWCVEYLCVGDSEGGILARKVHPDPVVSLVAEKVLEFHAGRKEGIEEGRTLRKRVSYADEL